MLERLLDISINDLMPDPSQPRKTFLKEEIDRLAASIAARGLMQPLRVLWDDERKTWRIVTGECRWRAARIAGLATVPCLPVNGEPDEADLLADQVIENSVRNDLLPLELGRSLAKLKALKGWNSQQMAKELGLSGAAITRAEALLELPESIQAMVDNGRIPISSGYELSRLSDATTQLELANAIASGRLTRDQTTREIQARLGKPKATPKRGRVSCKLDSGIAITVTAGRVLTWDGLIAALDTLLKQAKQLQEDKKEVTALGRLRRIS